MSIKTVFKQSSNYFWGEAAVMGASIISFPILTRIFTKEQYGLMALLAVTTGIIGGFFSMGLNRSIVRFYHQYRKSGELNAFVGSLFISSIGIQVIGLIISVGITWFFLSAGLISFKFFSLLPIALSIVILRNVFMLLNTLYRMNEEVLKYNTFSIIRQYTAMCAGILFVIIYQNLYSFYISQLAAYIIVVSFVVFQCYKQIDPFFKTAISKTIIKESLKYGFPLALSAMCSIVFTLGDRYVIAYFLDAEHVASYSVAFNLCNYFKEIVVTSINLSLIPLIFKLAGQGIVEAIRVTLKSVLKYYSMIVIPLLFIYILISKELIIIMASNKYIEAAEVLPVLMAGSIIGFNFPFSVGLHLRKKTSSIMIIIFFMAVINIILNCFLIPLFGIKGAAFSTLFCGIILIFCFHIVSRKFLSWPIPFKDIAKYTILSEIIYIIIFNLSKFHHFDHDISKAIVLTIIFITMYGGLLLVFDNSVRDKVLKIIYKDYIL